MKALLLILVMAVLSCPMTAFGLTQTATDVDNDARLTLAVEDTLFLNQPNPEWCLVEVEVTGDEVAFTNGDSIVIWVYEDDLVSDDLIFRTAHQVTATEVASQRVFRVFDCSTDPTIFASELGGFAEIYSEARVYKDDCSGFCIDDRPRTTNLNVALVDNATETPAVFVAWLGGAHPNPFNPRTTINYSIPVAGHVELEVYDLAGRHVRTVARGFVVAGEHRVHWNGADDTGEQVASGVYLYRLRAGEFVETKRMILLK